MKAFFGLEWEIALAGVDYCGDPAAIGDVLGRFEAAAKEHLVHVPDAMNSGIFLANGGRVYRDASNGGQAHSEACTPEVDSPDEMVRQLVAADRLVEQIARLGGGGDAVREITAFKNNVCYQNQVSFGHHENYSCDDRATVDRREFIAFLVSRSWIDGPGGFVAGCPGLVFTNSPRSHFFEVCVGLNTQMDRGIFSTKSSPLGRVRRLHVITGGANQSHLSAWLKYACAALAAMCLRDEPGYVGRPVIRIPVNPVAAIKRFALDPTCTTKVDAIDGGQVSALEIQHDILGRVENVLATIADPPCWAELACRRWRETLAWIAARRWDVLERRLDWRIKYELFGRHLARHGWSWDKVARWNAWLAQVPQAHGGGAGNSLEVSCSALRDRSSPLRRALRDAGSAGRAGIDLREADQFVTIRGELLELDLRYMQVGGSLFPRLAAVGLVDHRVPGLDLPDHDPLDPPPPPRGRGALRGSLVSEFGGRGAYPGRNQLRCSWGKFVHYGRGMAVDMPSSESESALWVPMPLAEGGGGGQSRTVNAIGTVVHAADDTIFRGTWEGAAAALLEARANLPTCPQSVQRDYYRVLARIQARRQMLDETLVAIAMLEEVEANRVEYLQDRSNVLCWLGLAGQPAVDEAIAAMEHYIADELNPRRASGVACWRAHLAMLWNRRGNPQETLRVAELGMRPCEFDHTNDHVRARLELESSDALRMSGTLGEARERLQRAISRCETGGYRSTLAVALQVRGRLEAASGRLAAARRALTDALEIQLELELPAQVTTRFLLARLANTDPRSRDLHRAEAEAAIRPRTALVACPLVAKVLSHWEGWIDGGADPAPVGISGNDPFWCL